MRKLGALLICVQCLAVIPQASAEEIVWRSRELSEGPFKPGRFLANQSGMFYRETERPQDFFIVYRKDQINAMLAARDQALAAQRAEAAEAARALRQEVGDAVTASLRALPEQLFGADARAALATEVAGRLTVVMEERIAVAREELRSEILAEVDRRLAARE